MNWTLVVLAGWAAGAVWYWRKLQLVHPQVKEMMDANHPDFPKWISNLVDIQMALLWPLYLPGTIRAVRAEREGRERGNGM